MHFLVKIRRLRVVTCFSWILLIASFLFTPLTHASQLNVSFQDQGNSNILKSLADSDFKKLKSESSSEYDSVSQKAESWKGVTLAHLIEVSIEGLPIEKRATIDLVVLKNQKGEEALIPRGFVTKFSPLIVMASEQGKRSSALSGRGPFLSVARNTSKPLSLKEELPVDRYSVSNLVEVELTNYKNRFASFYLEKRGDPAAVRGEKAFVQDCLGCHTAKAGIASDLITKYEAKTPDKHQKISDKSKRSLDAYLKAYQHEHASPDKK